MSKQIKYKVGETIVVRYFIKNPKKHEILNGKDKFLIIKALNWYEN